MRSGRTVSILLAGALATTLAGVPAASATKVAARTIKATALVTAEPTPAEQYLSRATRGAVAVERLGADLDEVAALNEMGGRELEHLLLTDGTAWVHSTGRVFFVDPAPADIEAAEPAEAPYPYSETFALHSRPGAAKTIYLDFDGHHVSGTLWNTDARWALPDETHPAFSLDGDPTTFTSTERDVIQGVWQRVSEDYAPFDVDVTTADPGLSGLVRDHDGDPVFGTRALITPSDSASTAICGGGCGGVAFVATFGSGYDGYQPAWVFPQNLGHNTKAIAEATSHEVGHNLGLDHDGTSTQGYYAGQGAWAPIMGNSYNRPISQWSKGEYSGAGNTEDDLAVITGNGLSPVPDDHGDEVAGATVVTATDRTATGLVSSADDQDVLEFSQGCEGPVTVSVSPASTSPNLDVRLRLLSADGIVLATSDPVSGVFDYDVATGMAASAQVSVTAGSVLHAEVDGVGAADPSTNGYSDYASLGNYTISSTGCAGADPGVVSFEQETQSAGETAGTALLTVVRTGSTSAAGSVDYSATGGTATPGADFTLPADTLDFAAGETSKTIPVTVLDDSADEADETVEVTLSEPGSGTVLGTRTQATLTIADDDAPPATPAVVTFEPAAQSADETDGTVDLVVTRTGDTSKTTTVAFARSGGSATAGEDFAFTPGTLTFAPGETRQTIGLSVVDDAMPEQDETVAVSLGSPSTGTELGSSTTSTLTITDDDAPAVVTFTEPSSEVEEDAGTVELTVTRTGNTLIPSTVQYERTAGSASPVSDVIVEAGSVTFAPGESTRTIELAVVDDELAEGHETVQVSLGGPSDGTMLGTAAATVTIGTSDQQPDLTISTRKRSGYLGDGEYATVPTSQTLRVSARRGEVRSFFVRVTNEGSTSVVLDLYAGQAKKGSKVTYTSSGVDITSPITSILGDFAELEPGESALIRADIRIGRKAKVGSTKPVSVAALWYGDGVRVDTVAGTVRVMR